jgi:hypothetical protein
MTSTPIPRGKPPPAGNGRLKLRPNAPTRLEIPSPGNTLATSSSAPSSLSPLILPATNLSSASSVSEQADRLTSELLNAAFGRVSISNKKSDGEESETTDCVVKDFEEDDAYTLKDEEFQDLERLGEGAGGTVTKVCHIPTGRIMAKKVCWK